MQTLKYSVLALVLVIASAACEYEITTPSPVINITNTNTNTNSNTNTIDLSDLIDFNPVIGTPGGSTCNLGCGCIDPVTGLACTPGQQQQDGTPLDIPSSSKNTATVFAEANPTLVATSCHNFAFLDGVVALLRQANARWGYVCRDANVTSTSQCTRVSGDSIAFRATNDNLGAWVIDIIADHCGAKPTFQWSVVGFDPQILWVFPRAQ